MTISKLKAGDFASMTSTVTEEDLCRYAQLTGDYNPIHMEENRAAARSDRLNLPAERILDMSEAACYEAEFCVVGRDSDCFSQCQAGALLSYLQETGLAALAAAGLSRSYLLERHNVFWMLARLEYTLKRPILLGDVITVRAWSRNAHGMGIYRDYEILRSGIKIGEALALWMLADGETRALFPAGRIPELAAVWSAPPEKKRQLKRLILPEELVAMQCRTVEYSQVDMNGHLNNSRYADLVCDAIGLGKLDGAYISSLRLSYLSECLPGCVLELSAGQRENVRYVRGTGRDGAVRFEAEAVLCRT